MTPMYKILESVIDKGERSGVTCGPGGRAIDCKEDHKGTTGSDLCLGCGSGSMTVFIW